MIIAEQICQKAIKGKLIPSIGAKIELKPRAVKNNEITNIKINIIWIQKSILLKISLFIFVIKFVKCVKYYFEISVGNL